MCGTKILEEFENIEKISGEVRQKGQFGAGALIHGGQSLDHPFECRHAGCDGVLILRNLVENMIATRQEELKTTDEVCNHPSGHMFDVEVKIRFRERE